MSARGCSNRHSLVICPPHLMGAVAMALLLAAMTPSRSQAESNTSLALADPARDDPTGGGPVVIPQSQRAPVSIPSGVKGPIVIPQGGVAPAANEPATNARGQTDDRVNQPRAARSDRAAPVPPAPVPAARAPALPRIILRPEIDGDPNMAVGFRETGSAEALYRATHFGGAATRPRETYGFFGAPRSGALNPGCGGRPNARGMAAADGCMSALAFAVSPPPATRGVLPRNLPRIPPKDAMPIPPVAADKPMTPPMKEMDPYEPTGFTAGNFLLKPAVEMATGYDTNPGRVPGGKGSPVVIIAPVLQVRSQFDRHQLNADIRTSYVDDTQLQQLSHPTVDAKVNGRYDLTDTRAINAEGHFALDADDPGTARFTGRFAKIPLVTTTGGSAGFTQKLDPVEVSVKAAADHVQFQDTRLTDGQILTNQDRNFNQFGAQSRVSYALTPELSPFVDVAVDQRIHNQPVDLLGFRRDSTGTAVEAGVTFGFANKLTGDFAVGYLMRQYQDLMLRPVSGFIADANLTWQATDATMIQFGAKSQVAEIAEAGISGVLRRDATVEIDHQFQPWLIGTFTTGYGRDTFVGSTRVDNRYFMDIGMLYKVSRLLQLKANVRREETRSNAMENNLTATVVQVGARVQY
jgi:hypothetical protein